MNTETAYHPAIAAAHTKTTLFIDSIRDTAKGAYALAYFLVKVIQEEQKREWSNGRAYLCNPVISSTCFHGPEILSVEEVVIHGHATWNGSSIADFLAQLSALVKEHPGIKELLSDASTIFKHISYDKKDSYLLRVRMTIKTAPFSGNKILKAEVLLDDFSFNFTRHSNSIANRWFTEEVLGKSSITISNISCGQDSIILFPEKRLMLARIGNVSSSITDKFDIIPEDERNLLKFIDPKAKILLDSIPDGFRLLKSDSQCTTISSTK